MAVKLTALGLLIMGAMLLYVAAAAALAGKADRTGDRLFRCGFLLALAAFILRWVQAGHLPLSNLFEVFLTIGVLPYPFAAACRRFLDVGGRTADALTGAVLLFPAALIFDAEPQRLPPILQSPFFGPHVASYVLGYLIMLKAGVHAAGAMVAPDPVARSEREQKAFRLVRLGFPLLTLGLALGAMWGKRAWGDYWNWDPKEIWGLAMWLVYVAYFQFRDLSDAQRPRAGAAIALAGSAAIVITALWVNLSRIFAGLHSYAS